MYDVHDLTAHGQDKLGELIKDIKFAMFTRSTATCIRAR